MVSVRAGGEYCHVSTYCNLIGPIRCARNPEQFAQNVCMDLTRPSPLACSGWGLARETAALCVSSQGSCSVSQQHLHTSEYSEDMIQTTHHMIRVCMITADAVTYTCNNQMCCLLLQQYRIGSVLYTLLCVAQGYCILSYSR